MENKNSKMSINPISILLAKNRSKHPSIMQKMGPGKLKIAIEKQKKTSKMMYSKPFFLSELNVIFDTYGFL